MASPSKAYARRREFLIALSSTVWSIANTKPSFAQPRRTERQSVFKLKPVLVDYLTESREPSISILLESGETRTAIIRVETQDLVTEFVRRLQSRSTMDNPSRLKDLAENLYHHLWAPVESAFSFAGDIFIRANGFLRLFPFEALYSGTKFVGQQFRIRHLVSTPLVIGIQPAPEVTKGRGLIYAPDYGDENVFRPLLATGPELAEIQKQLVAINWTVRKGSAANKEQYEMDLKYPFAILHLGTHGDGTNLLLGKRVPNSGVRIERTRLTPSEIREKKIHGELVVLAACDSALRLSGKDSAAEAYLHAGAKEVIAARWEVDDVATSEFMQSFYKHLGKGLDTSSAMTASRAEMIHSRYLPFRHPYFWSPFLSLASTTFASTTMKH